MLPVRALVVASSVVLVACSSDKAPAPSSGNDTGVAVLEDSFTPTDGTTPSDSVADDSGGGSDSTSGETTVPTDGGTDTSATDTSTTDAFVPSVCSVPYVAFGSKLNAGGATPAAFAAAYNDEVSKMTYPGPMLLIFKGTDGMDSSKWKLKVGPLQSSGSGVDFAGTAVETPYTLSGTGLNVDVAGAVVSFDLRFATATTTANLPVIGVALSGNIGGCMELGADYIRLAIPESAKDIPFHGSTVGALMGTPLTADGGPSGWVLELLGSTAKVTFTGGTP